MISVVIPAYNCEDTIVQCIDSVRLQTRYDLIAEIIIVNDGATDNTDKVMNEYIHNVNDQKIKYFKKTNGGVSSARNYGIKLAISEWIALLDSDDQWKNEKVERQITTIQNHHEIRFIGTGRNHENVLIGNKIENGLYSLSAKDILKKYWPHTSSVLVKREDLIDCNYYDESRTHAEDGQLWLKLAQINDLFYLSESLEIAGNYKQTFGESGLSANLKEMHIGSMLNIKEAYQRKQINLGEYAVFYVFEIIKYFRRKVTIKNANKKTI